MEPSELIERSHPSPMVKSTIVNVTEEAVAEELLPYKVYKYIVLHLGLCLLQLPILLQTS